MGISTLLQGPHTGCLLSGAMIQPRSTTDAITCAGLARTLFMEDRAAFGTAVDLSLRTGLPSLPALVGVLHDSGEFQVAMHGSAAYGLRLVPATAPRARPPSELRNATSIVSGGTKVTHATAHS